MWYVTAPSPERRWSGTSIGEIEVEESRLKGRLLMVDDGIWQFNDMPVCHEEDGNTPYTAIPNW